MRSPDDPDRLADDAAQAYVEGWDAPLDLDGPARPMVEPAIPRRSTFRTGHGAGSTPTYANLVADVHGLPWAGPWLWSRRCRAVREPRVTEVSGTASHYGRCELAPHPEDLDHALERGMDTPRWSTRWTG